MAYTLPKIKKLNKAAIRSFFKSDRAVLLASIGFALFFWLLVKLSQEYKTNSQVRVDYALPEGKTFDLPPTETIRTTLKGKGWDLLGVYFTADKRIRIELPDRPEHTVSSTSLRLRLQQEYKSALEIVDFAPDYLRLKLEPRVSKTVPVILHADIRYAEQYDQREPVAIRPDSVTVTGPQSDLDTLRNWHTKTLTLDDLKSDVTVPLPLQSPPHKLIRLDTPEVRVDVKVDQYTENSFFLPIKVKNAPDSIQIFPSRVKISAIVGLSRFHEVDTADFEAEVDLKGVAISSENNTLPIVMTKKPGWVKSIYYSPKSVEYYFVKKEAQPEEDSRN